MESELILSQDSYLQSASVNADTVLIILNTIV